MREYVIVKCNNKKHFQTKKREEKNSKKKKKKIFFVFHNINIMEYKQKEERKRRIS